MKSKINCILNKKKVLKIANDDYEKKKKLSLVFI